MSFDQQNYIQDPDCKKSPDLQIESAMMMTLSSDRHLSLDPPLMVRAKHNINGSDSLAIESVTERRMSLDPTLMVRT